MTRPDGGPPPHSTPAAERRAHLLRLLGGPDLAWLVDRARRRMELGRDLDGPVTNSTPSESERAAAARLLGRALRPARSIHVPLPAVDRILRESGACPEGLAAAVVELTGPVTPRHETEAARERAWQDAFAPLAAAVRARPQLEAWFTALRAQGLVTRLSSGSPTTAAAMLADLAQVVSALPAEDESLAAFAARVLADAHALDDDRPLSTLSLSAARALTGGAHGNGAQWRRETWAAVGLLKDELSSQVLTLGLPGDSATATGRALAALHPAGQPAVLTLRQLARDAPRPLPPGTRVFVCENPSVVAAAADRFAARCPPLVCVGGQPSAAAVKLLSLLAQGGATLLYHGDFDWGGLRIAAGLRARIGWLPWRFDTDAYRAALKEHPGTGALPPPSAVPTAAWDTDLPATMIREGRRVEEELVLADLLADLAQAAAAPVGLPVSDAPGTAGPARVTAAERSNSDFDTAAHF
ncbi:TIGR02679 family protein [Actinocrinis puniceicyclus]|uniref:TIGR02679 family protein n=1 Tax=Actinocrinis puniceicyclus TaxID=977794 RepID=A0A8J8BBA8_9ACTN|nr:TIGR02679 family protein [Actinocrinis puniceicyclus]MBS2961896.1 TIGR02679 family protein [Actinocrinis puniceicyclus]